MISMAQKRSFSNSTGIIVSEGRNQALGTLGASVAILIGTKLAMTSRFRCLKAEVIAQIDGSAAGEEARILFGLAHGDMTVAEIANALVQNGPIDSSLLSEHDAAKKPVWIAGAFESGGYTPGGQICKGKDGSVLMSVKPRWTFPKEGVGWNWFAFNFSNDALTTGSNLAFQAKHFGLWVK